MAYVNDYHHVVRHQDFDGLMNHVTWNVMPGENVLVFFYIFAMDPPTLSVPLSPSPSPNYSFPRTNGTHIARSPSRLGTLIHHGTRPSSQNSRRLIVFSWAVSSSSTSGPLIASNVSSKSCQELLKVWHEPVPEVESRSIFRHVQACHDGASLQDSRNIRRVGRGIV